jgi:hypothetical protein
MNPSSEAMRHPALEIIRPEDLGTTLRTAVAACDDAPGSLPVLLAALATGRFQRVRQALASLDGALLAALLPRYAAWSADLATAAASWGRARDAALATAAASETGDVVRAAALAGAERLASDLGDPATAARLRVAAREARSALAARARPLDPRPGPTPPSSPGAGRAGPDAGLAPHEARLATAFDLDLFLPDAFHPLAGQTPTYAPPDDAAAAVLELVHGVLGVQPDAIRHRLWLRPRLPPGCVALEVREITAGADAVRAQVELGTDRLVVRVEQDAGALPLTLLLEPYVPGAVVFAEVDGRTASLAPRPAGDGGSRLPVQLVLDHERVVEIGYAAAGG